MLHIENEGKMKDTFKYSFRTRNRATCLSIINTSDWARINHYVNKQEFSQSSHSEINAPKTRAKLDFKNVRVSR